MKAQAKAPAREQPTPVVLVRVDDAYLPLTVLRAYSGLSVRTLRGYLASRTRPLPHFRIGGKILVRRSDFDAWASQFRATATAETIDTLVDNVMAAIR